MRNREVLILEKAFLIQRGLGSDLLQSTYYERVLSYELKKSRLKEVKQVIIPFKWNKKTYENVGLAVDTASML